MVPRKGLKAGAGRPGEDRGKAQSRVAGRYVFCSRCSEDQEGRQRRVSPRPSAPLVESAPAKVNLTLRVLGRRSDGYHEIESLVAFAEFGDRLRLSPGDGLTLAVNGPTAVRAGDVDSNLVLKAALEMTARQHGLTLGAFRLEKRLPVAAGLV